MYRQDDRVLPAYAGLATFLRAPAVGFDEIREGWRVVVGVPFDGACGARPGARYGPHAIRYSSLHLHYYASSSPGSVMVDLETGDRLIPSLSLGDDVTLVDVGDVSVYPSNIGKTAESVEASLSRITARGATPLMLGGDHYVTYPAVRGVVAGLGTRLAKPPEEVRLGYIQVDAHFDLASDNTIYGRHFHGAPARLVSELPAVALGRMAWIGQRGFVRQEQWDFAQRENLRYYTPGEIRRRGAVEVVREALDRVSDGADGVYVTMDIDVVDIAEAPGTGAISFGGLAATEYLELAAALRDDRVVGLDLVEVAPNHDPTERTARLAAMALLRFLMRPAG